MFLHFRYLLALYLALCCCLPVAQAATTSQTITITQAAPASAEYDSSFVVAATSSSGLPVSITSSGGCTGAGTASTSITMTSPSKDCTVNYQQAGDTVYFPAPALGSVTAASKASQIITVTQQAPEVESANGSFTVSATASSGLRVAISSSGGCTGSGTDTATITMAGNVRCTVTYSQAGSVRYQAAPALLSDTLIEHTLTITQISPSSAIYAESFTVTAEMSSGLPVLITTEGGCSGQGSDAAAITMTSGVEECRVFYDATNNENYLTGWRHLSITTAAKAQNAIAVTQPAPELAVYGSAFTVAANTPTGVPVLISASGGCEGGGTDNVTVNMISGTEPCSVVYESPADENNYTPATPISSITQARKAPQTITVTQPAPASAVYGSHFGVLAMTSSGLPVTIYGEGGCEGSGRLNMNSGTTPCTVMFTQEGDENFEIAEPVSSFTAAVKADPEPSLRVWALYPQWAYGSTASVEVGAYGSFGNYLLGRAEASGSCSGSGFGTVQISIISGTGTCTIAYAFDGDDNHNATTTSYYTVDTQKATQSISVTKAPPANAMYGSSFDVSAAASSGLPVTIIASGECVLTDGNRITMTRGNGLCSVRFSQLGDDNYYLAQEPLTYLVMARKADQTITLTQALPASAAYRSSFTVAATASSGLPVIVTASGGCQAHNNIVTMTSGSNACLLSLEQSDDGNYQATVLNRLIQAEKAQQSIIITNPAPASATERSLFEVKVSASSGLLVNVSQSAGCSIVDDKTETGWSPGFGSGSIFVSLRLVTKFVMSGQGDCTIAYSQAGDQNNLPASPVTSTTILSPWPLDGAYTGTTIAEKQGL